MRMFNDSSTTLSLLATRRSAKARDLVAPGPDASQLRNLLEAAIRVPDHGKLAPWRFVIVGHDQRVMLADAIEAAYVAATLDAGRLEREAMRQFAQQAPTLIVALSRPIVGHKIPQWEQELSAGAAIQNLCIAAHAQGFAANWLTGWPAYSDAVRALFGDDQCRIAGFIFVGTPSRPLEERPRPNYDDVVSNWGGPNA